MLPMTSNNKLSCSNLPLSMYLYLVTLKGTKLTILKHIVPIRKCNITLPTAKHHGSEFMLRDLSITERHASKFKSCPANKLQRQFQYITYLH